MLKGDLTNSDSDLRFYKSFANYYIRFYIAFDSCNLILYNPNVLQVFRRILETGRWILRNGHFSFTIFVLDIFALLTFRLSQMNRTRAQTIITTPFRQWTSIRSYWGKNKWSSSISCVHFREFVKKFLGPTIRGNPLTAGLKLMMNDDNRNYLPNHADIVRKLPVEQQQAAYNTDCWLIYCRFLVIKRLQSTLMELAFTGAVFRLFWIFSHVILVIHLNVCVCIILSFTLRL